MAKRILLVEDDADLQIGVALRLKSMGHEVLSAMSGAEAVPLARTHQPDLILLDIGLPDCSGHAVARSLSTCEATQRIPVLYLTARHELKHRIEAGLSGAAGYLVKPCTADKLTLAIDAVIHSGRIDGDESESGAASDAPGNG